MAQDHRGIVGPSQRVICGTIITDLSDRKRCGPTHALATLFPGKHEVTGGGKAERGSIATAVTPYSIKPGSVVGKVVIEAHEAGTSMQGVTNGPGKLC